MTAPAPSRLEAATVTRYAACTVDPRPSRAVHCPDLNACLVDAVDCRAVHFGYAVPVTVEPLAGEPRLAELVLDPSPELSPAAVAYLLERHPQLRRPMAATERLQRQPQPDDDIAAIAKQISDHAEAIYQTWKSRGLAPAEILSCHGGPAAADKFGPALTPQQGPGAAPPPAQPKRRGGPVVDLLASDASLEQFVNNFVVEDKARLAAARNQTKPLPSSIQYALQKFETSPRPFTPHHARTPSIQPKLSPYRKADSATPEPRKVVSPYRKAVDAAEVESDAAAKASPYRKAVGAKPVEPEAQKMSPYQKAVNANAEQNAPKVSPYQKLVGANAVDGKMAPYQKAGNAVESPNTSAYHKSAEPKTSPYQKASEPKSSPYQKAVEQKSSPYRKAEAKTSSPYQKAVNASAEPFLGETIETTYPPDLPTADDKPKRTAAYMEEVAREEERLINALKTGVVIAEDPAAPADKKAAILLKKSAAKAAAAPHPELTTQQRQHLRHTSANPVRPFLTRGSVAERVLIFEKAPSEVMRAVWRSGGHDVQTRVQNYSRDKENVRPSLPPNTTLQRHVKANRNVHIPRFYYPKGKPQGDQLLDGALQKIATAFQQFPNQQVPRDKFSVITKACGCPLYWKIPLFIIAGGDKLGYVEGKSFLDFWKQLTSSCHDEASRFMYILSKGQLRPLVTEDFIPLVQDVVDTHPGLTFLKEATEFHSRYVHTVITRIFYCVNRSWSGKITLPELRRSDLLRVIQLLEEEEDINQVTAYFSYEHFYVIYCKFWELDRDHDLYIDQQDLARHSDHALSGRMIERIFSGAVTRGAKHEEKMSYTDFVWFLLSEEDKSHPTAIEYWFRCMDLDGDGFLSMYELEYFYEEQLQRMETIGMETLPFEDCLCQMLDMIRPRVPGKLSLTDLKRCKMTPIFFDTFFNLEKYLDHEQRDPFASQREHDTEGHELSDWDRYAAEEYELLVAEEGGNEQQDELPFDDDGEDDILSPNLDMIMMSPLVTKSESHRNGENVSAPSFRVTDFDSEEADDSADYAADSDCSV